MSIFERSNPAVYKPAVLCQALPTLGAYLWFMHVI